MENDRILTVDLGGTRLRTGLVSKENEIIEIKTRPSRAGDGYQVVMGCLFSQIDDFLCNETGVKAIAMAIAGGIDMEHGIVTQSPNLPGWYNVPLYQLAIDRYHVPTFIINDGNAAALAEHQFGAGRGTNNMVYIAVGTGVGGGIIINGQLYLGSHGTAGEIGHLSLDYQGGEDACGSRGCLETLVSGKTIARIFSRKSSNTQKPNLKRIEGPTTQDVAEAAKLGNEAAQSVINHAALALGFGLVNIVNVFDPEKVVIGGGVSNLGDQLIKPALAVVKKRAFRLPVNEVSIVTSKLGDRAGLLGAALYAWKKLAED